MKFLISCPEGKIKNSYFDRKNTELLNCRGEACYNPYSRHLTVDEAEALITDCDVYVTVWGAPGVDERLLSAAPNLKVVLHLGGNGESVICRKALERGVALITGERYIRASAAECILGVTIAALRNVPEHSMRLKYYREWVHSWETSRGVMGKTVGFINYNGVASELARLLKPFYVRLTAYDALPIPDGEEQGVEQCSLEWIMSHADIIYVNSPIKGGAGVEIGTALLCLMKDGATIVDVSAGGVLKYDSVLYALSTKCISAVLDFCENQPSRTRDAIMCLPNVTPMPCMSSPASDLRLFMTERLLRECMAYLNGGGELDGEILSKKTAEDKN